MKTVDGVVTIVQETRFLLTDDRGIPHLFLLGHDSLAEPEQLEPLARDQTRIRVRYSAATGMIGFVAHGVAAL